MNTLARLLGPEGQLEAEVMLSDCPPTVRAAAAPRRWANYMAEEFAPDLGPQLDFDLIEYVREFVVPGDDLHPGHATYRRPIQWR